MTSEGIQPGFPDWFHPRGASMEVLRQGHRFLVLASDTARIKVSPRQSNWLVEWTVSYPEACINGATVLPHEELRAAFGLSNYSPTLSKWMLRRWEADCASEGRFIRSGMFTNIPGPGTGHDGDPNVSIQLTDNIKLAIDNLLNRNHRRPIFLKMGFATIVADSHTVTA